MGAMTYDPDTKGFMLPSGLLILAGVQWCRWETAVRSIRGGWRIVGADAAGLVLVQKKIKRWGM